MIVVAPTYIRIQGYAWFLSIIVDDLSCVLVNMCCDAAPCGSTSRLRIHPRRKAGIRKENMALLRDHQGALTRCLGRKVVGERASGFTSASSASTRGGPRLEGHEDNGPATIVPAVVVSMIGS